VFECVESNVVIVQQRAPLLKVDCFHNKLLLSCVC